MDRKFMLEKLLEDYMKDLELMNSELLQYQKQKMYFMCDIQNERIVKLHNVIETIVKELQKL